MEIQLTRQLKNIHKRVSALVPIMLALKYYSFKKVSFYVIVLGIKFAPILILTSTFNISEANFSNGITTSMRYLTANLLISKGFSSLSYLVLCVIFYVFELSFIAFDIYYFFMFKRRKKQTKNINISKIYITIAHLHIIISQFIIEFLSYAFHISWFQSFPINNTFSKGGLIAIKIINAVFIIIINAHTVLLFQSVNTPFNQKLFPIQIRSSKYKIALMLFIENLALFGCVDLYINSNKLKLFRIIMSSIILFVLILTSLLSLNEYNFKNTINKLIAFLLCLSFISMVIEIIISLSYYPFIFKATLTLTIISLCKILSAIVLVVVLNSINRKILNFHSRKLLFKIFDHKVDRKTIDIYLNVFENLENLRKGMKGTSQELLSVIFDHKEKCLNEKCKCQLIEIFRYKQETEHRKEYCKMLVSRIGFLIETSFVQIDYSFDYELSIFLAEYFFTFKSNPIMAYSIINSYLHTNIHQMSIEKTLTLYSVSQKYIIYCNKRSKAASVNFSEFYMIYLNSKIVNKKMVYFCDLFNKMIEIKESFEGSIKVSYENDSEEVSHISSSFLTSNILDIIITIIQNNAKCYLSLIQTVTESNIELMPIEHLIKINLFFNLFNSGKLPKKIRYVIEQYINTNRTINHNSKVNDLLIDLISILYQEYDDQLYSGNIIVKLADGLKIEYMSDKLCTDLGYVQSCIIKEDLGILLPKKIRESHHQAIMHSLLVNNHYNYSHSCYIFTAQGHSVPCSIVISTLAGISKDFSLICNVQIKQINNKFSFILNDQFESVALSESFFKIYGFSNQLVNNFNISLLELFNLQSESIKHTFNKEIIKINAFKRLNDINTKVSFTKGLLCNRKIMSSSDNDVNVRKFKVLEEQKESKTKKNDYLQSKKNIELLYSMKVNEYKNQSSFTAIRPKSIVIQNFIKLIAKFNEMEVYDERYKKLNEALYKLRVSMRNDLIANKKSKPNNVDNMLSLNVANYIATSYYDIKVEVKALYDKPIYLVKMIELFGNIPKPDLTKKSSSKITNVLKGKTKTTTGNTGSPILSYRKLTKGIEHKLTFKQIPLSNRSNNDSNICNITNDILDIPNKKNSGIIQLPNIETPQSSSSIIKSLLIDTHKNPYVYSNNKEIRKEIKGRRNMYPSYRCLFILLFLCLFVAFILNIINYTFQTNLLTTDNIFFRNIISLNYQRDKYLSVYCLVISILYKVSTLSLSSNQVTDSDLDNYYLSLKESVKGLDNSYHIFYSSYLDYKDKKNLPFTEMAICKEFIQIKLNWIEIKYQSDYFTEMQMFSLLCNKVVYHREDIGNLSIDVDQFLFDRFLLYPEQDIKTDYSRLLYYLGSNYVLAYEELHFILIDSIYSAFNKHHNDSKFIIVSIEIIILLIYLLFFGLVIYYLYIHNSIIFNSILRMFIYSSPGEEYNHKHFYFNYSLKQKIKSLLSLTSNFNTGYLSNFLLGDTNRNRRLAALSDIELETISSPLMKINQLESSHQLSNNNVSRYQSINDMHAIGNDNLHNKTPSSKSIKNVRSLQMNKSQRELDKNQFHHHSHNTNPIIPHNIQQSNSSTNICNSSNNTNTYILSSTNNTTKSKLIHTASNVIQDRQITKRVFLKNSKKEGVAIVKILAYSLFFFLIVFIIYFSLTISSTLSYFKSIEGIFLDFSDFINYYSLIYIYFNELRIKLISPTFVTSDRLLDTMTEKIYNVTRDIEILLHSRLNIFPETFELIERLNVNASTLSQEDIEYFCNNNDICINLYNSNSSQELLSEGLNMGVNAMFLQMTNLYKDYLVAKDGIETVEDIKTLIISNNFRMMEQTLDFVLNNIKENIYKTLEYDELFLRNTFQREMLIYTCLAIIYCIFVFVVVMSIILFNIQTKVKFIVFGSYKFNQPFLYSFFIDARNSDGMN